MNHERIGPHAPRPYDSCPYRREAAEAASQAVTGIGCVASRVRRTSMIHA